MGMVDRYGASPCQPGYPRGDGHGQERQASHKVITNIFPTTSQGLGHGGETRWKAYKGTAEKHANFSEQCMNLACLRQNKIVILYLGMKTITFI